MAWRIQAVAEPVEFHLDGKTIQARKGEPIVYALIAAGRGPIIRSAKLRRPRGPWCLRGACDGCLARVDGIPNVMTCMHPVRGGERVESQNVTGPPDADLLGVTDWLFPNGIDHHHLLTAVPGAARVLTSVAAHVAGLGTLPDPTVAPRDVNVGRPAVVVVGAGPAGLAVASALEKRGIELVLIDDGPMDGGSLMALGADICESFMRAHPVSSSQWLRQSTAAGVFDGQVLVIGSEATWLLRPRALVLATGAQDPGPAFAGNDLPGVMAARAVAKLAANGIAIGKQIVVAGQGVYADAVKRLLGPHASIEHVELSQVQAASGRTRVQSVELQGASVLPADALAVEAPRSPCHELVVQAGGRVKFDPARGYVPVADSHGRVAPAVWVTGECAGDDMDVERIAKAAQAVAADVAEQLSQGA